MEIIGAKQTDASVLTDLINLAYEHEYRWKTSARTTEEEVLSLLSKPEVYFFKGVLKNELVACAILEIREKGATFSMLSVRPELQGKGLGYQMILFLEAFAKDQGCVSIGCEVASFNTHLMQYYEKLAYVWYDSKPWNKPFLKQSNVSFEFYRKKLLY